MKEGPKFEAPKAEDNFFLDKNIAPGKSKDPLSDFEAELQEEQAIIEALRNGYYYETPYLDQTGKLRISVRSREDEEIVYDDSIEGYFRINLDAGILLGNEDIARYQSLAKKELDNPNFAPEGNA